MYAFELTRPSRLAVIPLLQSEDPPRQGGPTLGRSRRWRPPWLRRVVAWLVPLAGLLGACASGGMREDVRDPFFVTRERVVSHASWLDVSKAPTQYRPVSSAPLFGPYYILVSQSHHYCVVDAATFTVARDNDYWPCEWHFPRPGELREAR